MRHLWSENENVSTLNQIDKAWGEAVEEERSDLLKDFFSLSENQRKLLIYIANDNKYSIYSNEAAQKMNIPISSISRGLNSLIEKDCIEKTSDAFQIIVPAYKTLLRE